VVLDEGMTFHPLTPQEMQIIETQAFLSKRWRVCSILHRNKSSSTSTNNNIEQQTLDHASDTIQPFITNIEQEYAIHFN
jgi:hypothetical protein